MPTDRVARCALQVGVGLALEPPKRLSDWLENRTALARKTTMGRRVPAALSIISALAKVRTAIRTEGFGTAERCAAAEICVCIALVQVCLAYTQCIGAVSRFSRVRWPSLFVRFHELVGPSPPWPHHLLAHQPWSRPSFGRCAS
jgi:hypothetical protein